MGNFLYRNWKKLTFDLPSQVWYKIRTNLIFKNGSEMFDRIYEQFDDFLPRSGSLLVDIGCQYADYSIVANRLYGAQVVAFEPLLRNFLRAQDSISRNKASVEILNFGLSDREHKAIMFSDKEMLSIAQEGAQSEEIEFRTLDSYHLKPDIIKIDVEGFEMEVLRGASDTIERSKPRIIIEAHSSELEKQVRIFLEAKGYILRHRGKTSGAWRYSNWMDYITNLFFEYDQWSRSSSFDSWRPYWEKNQASSVRASLNNKSVHSLKQDGETSI